MAGAEDLGPNDRRAVLLDFDGTLYELAQDLSAFRSRWGEGPVARVLENLPANELAAALDDLGRIDMEAAQNGRPLVNSELIEELRAQYPVAIVSSNAEPAIAIGLNKMGLSGIPVVGRESSRRPKPDPEPVRLALARLGVEGGILVGDTKHDVEAARAAGITSVVVPNPKLAFRPQNADYYLESLQELPQLIEELWVKRI